MRRQDPALCASTSPTGFVLLDASLNPIVVNRIAAEVLAFPQKLEATKRFEDSLVSKMRSTLLSQQTESESPVVREFRSGKRTYSCRYFRVDAGLKNNGQITMAILIERGASQAVSVTQAAERYHLTSREQDVLRFLLEGLTSKEIAERMGISPNTVKAFLRLIMIKMGVSTRSGIVSKAIVARN
jgi:DNA-binding CsgD family transcriptional regulator